MPLTLVEFLKARLDEEQRLALAVADGAEPWPKEWTASEDGDSVRTWNGHVVVWGRGTLKLGVAAHIARHDPARVLREVEAKRRIIAAYERALDRRRAHPDDLAAAGALLALHGVCKDIALPYEDHPDYDGSCIRP